VDDPARPLAISYVRFSDPKQRKGSSESRQDADFARFCERHNLRPAPEGQHFADRGRSARSGAHRTKGDLGRLEALAASKAFPPGTVLVIEAWDRLSRMRPDKTIELLSSLLRSGLRIGVCRLDDLFTEADFGTHKFTTLSVFVQLAFPRESAEERPRGAGVRRTEAGRPGGGSGADPVPPPRVAPGGGQATRADPDPRRNDPRRLPLRSGREGWHRHRAGAQRRAGPDVRPAGDVGGAHGRGAAGG
jgi:DNA invertase Pin-like site-specific DNA recombinase